MRYLHIAPRLILYKRALNMKSNEFITRNVWWLSFFFLLLHHEERRCYKGNNLLR